MKKTNKQVKVQAPEGYHWETQQGRHYLAKGKGSTAATFRVVSNGGASKAEQAMEYARRASK